MKHDKSRSYAEGYAEGYAAGREASHSEVLLRELAREKWASSAPIPTDSKHPARRWLAARHLWRPDLQLPPSVRWLQAEGPPSVGGLLAAFAPPGQLEPSGVQLVSVDVDGRPAPDIDGPDGLAMRSIGAMRGAVCVLGMPAADRGVNVAEGLDDALALAARLPWPAVSAWAAGVVRSISTLPAGGASLSAGDVWPTLDGRAFEAAFTLIAPRRCASAGCRVSSASSTAPPPPRRAGHLRPWTLRPSSPTPATWSAAACRRGKRAAGVGDLGPSPSPS